MDIVDVSHPRPRTTHRPVAPSVFDAQFFEAAEVVISMQQVTASFLQRRLRIGQSHAGNLVDLLHVAGIVGEGNQVLVQNTRYLERFR